MTISKPPHSTSTTEPPSPEVVLSTNIAEASVTIDDVVYVIDTGVRKERSYDAGGEAKSEKERVGQFGVESVGVG